MPVLIDFESRSRVDLKSVGGRRYWEDASSQAIVCVWYDTRTGDVGAWYPGQPWPHPNRVLAAHNAHGFDRFAADRYDFQASGWIDTSQLARKAGLPGALDDLGIRWCDTPKDKDASKFTRALSSVRRPREIDADVWRDLPDDMRRRVGVLPELDAAGLERVVRYCASDVLILAQAWPRLRTWQSVDADAERVDRVINDRGIAFDSALAVRLLQEDARVCDLAVNQAAAELGMDPADVRDAASSPQQFTRLTGAPNAQAATVEAMDHPLARARIALASIARGKCEAGLARVHADGRLRDTLRYYGAHTGRWSGKGMQLQNLPRPAARLEEVDVDTLAAEVLGGRQCDADEIALLLRALLTAQLGSVLIARDFASVEARATAWAAEDHAALDVFRSGRDPYKVAAAAIFCMVYETVDKAQRQIGKISELALGFGGGPAAFERFAALYRIDLSALNVPDIVRAWRDLHSPIVQLWRDCDSAFRAAIGGKSKQAGPFEFVHADSDDAVACFLPSGRPIVYHEPRQTGRDLSYLDPRGNRVHVYGGKLVENAVQAFCRDLMARAMCRAEAEGLRPVLTVHDEIVCEVPAEHEESAAQALQRIMTDCPQWAAGMPLGASGWQGQRYRK